MPTAQAVFDTVWTHLEKMPRRAVSGVGGCQYRTFQPIDGEEVELRCAIGCLLPDNLPDDVFAFQGGVSALLELHPEVNEFVWPEDIAGVEVEYELDYIDQADAFLRRLQYVHDNDKNWGDFGFERFDKLREIADDYGLEVPE